MTAAEFYHSAVTARGADEYAFQADGVAWLAERNTAYLADEMGLGKSPQMILAADYCQIPFVQVVCPAIAVTDWVRKFGFWSSFGRDVYASYNSSPVPPAGVRPRSAIICGYETAIAQRKLLQANPHGGVLIIDEAHYLKNGRAQRTRGFYGKGCSAVDSRCIIQPFERVWLASGTPVPNGDPREMWAHVRALRPYSIRTAGGPMSYTEWCDEFCVFQPGLGVDKVIGVRNEQRFLHILDDFMLRRLGSVAGLPDVRFEVYPMEPRNVPREFAVEAWPELAEALHRVLDRAADGDLDSQLEEQLATLRRLTGLLKVEATVELVGEELRSGQLDRVIIFGYHVDVVEAISRRLRQFGAASITGATSEAKRWAAVDAFKSGHNRVIVANILAGGTNLSLGNSRHVVFAETDWTPENNRQAAFRARRIDGHRDPVLARIVSIDGTIDDLLQRAAQRKLAQTHRLLPN